MKRFIFPAVLVVSLVASSPWSLDSVHAPGGGGVTSPINNLVVLDAADPVMNITGGLAINGTYAHIYVHNLSGLALTGRLDLEDPNGTLVVSETIQASGIVLMYDVNLGTNGTWKVKSDLGAPVTQFDVVIWDGEADAEVRQDLVTLFPEGEGFIPNLIIAFGEPGVVLNGTESTQGELEFDGNLNQVRADAINVTVSIPSCGPPGSCSPIVAKYINATSINIDFDTLGDTAARIILVQSADLEPLPANVMAGCAGIDFDPPVTEPPFFGADNNAKCALLLQVHHDYQVDVVISGVFGGEGGRMPIPDLKQDRDVFHVQWA